MVKNNKEELEDKLIEELEGDYEENSGNRRLLIIGGIVAAILVLVAIILSLLGGNKKTNQQANTNSSDQAASSESTGQKGQISYDQDYSRNPDSELAKQTGEPSQGYPPKTSGARIPVDESGKSIDGVPIQQSLMIDDRENPFHTLHTIAPDIHDLMEINFYSVQNKALTLGEFTDRARVEIPGELFNRMDNFYRIFMYRAADEKGPGTAIVFSTSMDKTELEKVMRDWEKSMVDNLRPFVLIGLKKDFVSASGKRTFQNSSLYNGGRYIDFTEGGLVSLNYIVLDKYIIFANSRSTFEKTIELLQKKQ